MDRRIGGVAMRDIELVEQRVKADAVDRGTETDAQGTPFIVRAHRDDRVIEAAVRHARHGQQELAGEIGQLMHIPTIGISASPRHA